MASVSNLISYISGKLTQIVPVTSSAGTTSAGQIPALNAEGLIDTTMLPASPGAATVSVVADVALAAGDFVNLYDNAGVLNAQLATNTAAGFKADGYVTAAVAASSTGTVYLSGINSALVSLTVGVDYYLGAAGAVTSTPPTSSGYVAQYVGKALSATSIGFQPEAPIVLA